MNHDVNYQKTSSSNPQAQSKDYTISSAHLAHVKKDTLTPKEKERVDSADAPFNQRRCLVENYPHNSSVQYCHVMDRKHARNEDLMASLEWNWNMPCGALNLNTRYNIFFAGAALHLHHDNDSWGLLPERSIIDHYYERLDEERTKFPKEELLGDGFEYRLIPLGDSMKLYCILRQNEHAPPPNKDQYTFHFYPFDTLPPFRSHLHPKFAIIELGRKYHELRGKNLAAASAALSSYPILSRVNRIYAAWLLSPKGSPLFEEWKNKGSTDGNKDPQSESSSGTGYDSWRNLGRQIEDEDRQSESSSNTGYDSWRNPFKRKRTDSDNPPDRDRQSESSSNTGPDSWRLGVKRRRTGNVVEQGCPTPAGKSSDVISMANSSCETLSHRSLIEHERLHGKGRWTQESLSGWAADASNYGTP